MKFKALAFTVFGLLLLKVPETTAQGIEPPISLEKLTQTPKVPIQWDRYYDYAGLTEICAKLARAFPDLVKLETIGDSQEGRRIWVLTITDFTTGDPYQKPAYYLDGNLPDNDVHASEFALYTAWYLAENFQAQAFIKELLQQRTFYILPAINPDARDHFMHSRKNAVFLKTDQKLDDEETINPPSTDDLNQDGYVTYMRRKSEKGQ